MKNPIIEGNIVKTYKIGNSTINIYDSEYISKTPEEIDKILKSVKEIALKIVIANSFQK